MQTPKQEFTQSIPVQIKMIKVNSDGEKNIFHPIPFQTVLWCDGFFQTIHI